MKNKKFIVKRPLGLACLGLVLCIYLYTRIWEPPEPVYPAGESSQINVSGRVTKKEYAGEPDALKKVIYLKPEDDSCEILCYLDTGQAFPRIGSTVMVTGKWKSFEKATNPGQFDAFSYYQILKISYGLYQTQVLTQTTQYHRALESLYQFCQCLADALNEALPIEEAGMMKTMLLGEKGGMDKDLKALYQRNGIAHILAISGLHISLLGMGLFHLFRKIGVPVRLAGILGAVFLILYGAMIGFSPSAVRAIIMFILHMMAKVVRRTYDMLTSLAVAAVLLLLEQPLYLYHSGFVFSFSCVLGIGMLMPALTISAKTVITGLLQMLLGGLTMAVITLPVYLWFYYQFPVYSIFLNFLIIPLMTFLMVAGLLLLALQLICPALTVLPALFICGVIKVYEWACTFCEKLPGYLFTPGQPEVWQMLVYLGIVILVVALKKKLRLWLKWSMVLVAVFILVMRPQRNLEVTFLDVGQGDCIFVQTEDKACYLIDGGSSSVSKAGTYRLIPFLKHQGAHTLEAVFVTHADADHCNGILELLENGKQQGISVKNLVLPDIHEEARDDAYEELIQMARASGINLLWMSRGQSILAKQLNITCMHPAPDYRTENANEYSTVLWMEYGEFRMLLTGDVEGQGEAELQNYLAQSVFGDERLTVLKVAHHGSRNSTAAELLKELNPFYAVISCGKSNSYGHPHEELLERLEQTNTRWFRTDEYEAITIETDGKQVWIQTFV